MAALQICLRGLSYVPLPFVTLHPMGMLGCRSTLKLLNMSNVPKPQGKMLKVLGPTDYNFCEFPCKHSCKDILVLSPFVPCVPTERKGAKDWA